MFALFMSDADSISSALVFRGLFDSCEREWGSCYLMYDEWGPGWKGGVMGRSLKVRALVSRYSACTERLYAVGIPHRLCM